MSNLLAAVYPEARFHAVDFNPVHCEVARSLAAAAGLGNVTFHAESFADLLARADELPQMDFIVLHGVWSWVDDANRNILLEILKRMLKPGGMMYISYNTQPGFALKETLRRFLSLYSQSHEGTSLEALDRGRELARAMMDSKTSLFGGNIYFRPIFNEDDGCKKSHLVHEYMHAECRAFYFADVSRALAQLGIHFVGLADLVGEMELPPYLTSAAAGHDPRGVWYQTLRDYAYNARFRADIFVREPVRLSPQEVADRLDRQRLTFWIIPTDRTHDYLPPPEGAPLSRENLEALVSLLKESCPTVGEIVAAFPHVPRDTVTHYLAAMLKLDVIAAARSEAADPGPANRFNAAVCADDPLYSRYKYLASPVLGNGVQGSDMDFLVREVLESEGLLPPHEFASAMERALRRPGRSLEGERERYHDELELRSSMAGAALRVETRTQPFMRKLGLLSG